MGFYILLYMLLLIHCIGSFTADICSTTRFWDNIGICLLFCSEQQQIFTTHCDNIIFDNVNYSFPFGNISTP